MERIVYAILEKANSKSEEDDCIYLNDWGAYWVYRIFTDEQKAEELCERLNYERTVNIIEKRGIKAVFHQFEYYYTEENIFELLYQFEKAEVYFDNFSFEDFKRMQAILDSIYEDSPFGNKIDFYEVKELIQNL